MSRNMTIDYIEFTVPDLAKAKAFYGDVFGWTFVDYGPDYVAFNDGRIDGGFTVGETVHSNPLVVFYAEDLEGAEARVVAAGGEIDKPIFSFPGGRRFEYRDPNGLRLAVWSEDPNAND